MTHPRPRSLQAAIILLCLIFVSVPLAGLASSQRPAPARLGASRAPGSSSKPKLVVVIVIDQFRYDYLERFGDLFGKGGFRRLISQGALFTNANYSYVPTFTACGHAAIFTGSVPSQNGIVGNAWFDRDQGRVRVMVSDDNAKIVTGKGPEGSGGVASPRALIGTTIGDQMRLATNLRSKVVAISYKDRSAVLPGGQRPNGAFWFHDAIGEFVSSDYYSKELPEWVRTFNKTNRPDKFFGAKWDRSLPAAAYERAQAQNLAIQTSAIGNSFPHTVTGGEEKPGPKFYSAFQLTPFASQYLEEFGKAAIENEQLGSDSFPDLFSISFSSPDLTGHYYGPDSQEIVDVYSRLDGFIADLLDFIDKRVGLNNTIVAVTGDHGVAPVPEYAASLGYDAERLPPGAVTEAVNQALTARFGEGKWVQAFVNDQFYLDQKLIAARKADPAEVERIAGEAALGTRGVVDFFTRTQIVEGRMANTQTARRVVNGFNRKRSGDVWVITKPFSFFVEGGLPTTHGSPYNYDTHVPIIFFGAGVQAGRYNAECAPSDIAPTLAALLGVEQPSNRAGRVLVEAIAEKGKSVSAR
ncbi:MAG TPA: alkaline phosphatase family protein [Blastocatellia bacterium]|nr:alkaline phosphatase family protein [Blastocatellia bacterium]